MCAQSTRPRPFPTPFHKKPAPSDDVTPMSLFPTRGAWTLALNNRLMAPPAYDDIRAYFAIDGGRVVAYTLGSGTQLWLVTAVVRLQPAAGDGLVFLVEPDALTARRAVDGSVAWQLPFAETLAAPPVWDNGWLVAATSAGSILAFRAADGHLIWRHEIGSPATASPALAADRVYVPTDDGRVVALRVDEGTPLWERRLGGKPGDILAFDDRLYTGSKDNFLYCLLTKDGEVDWRWRTGADVIGRPAFDERHIYFVSLDNMLRSLDRTSGAQTWIRPLPLRPMWGPVKAGELVIVGGQVPTLYAYGLKDGNGAGDLAAGAEVAAAPHVFDDPDMKLPSLIIITRHIAAGAAAVKVTRSLDPSASPLTAPLPNVIPMSTTPEK